MPDERRTEGWFYKQDGQAVGPVSTKMLRELLAVGRVHPSQPVWRRDGLNLSFVRAAVAIRGRNEERLPDRQSGIDSPVP